MIDIISLFAAELEDPPKLACKVKGFAKWLTLYSIDTHFNASTTDSF